MIRINLLPVRASRKREYVKQQLILFAVLLAGGVVAMYMTYNWKQNQIQNRKSEINRTKQQIEQYTKAIGEVNQFKDLEAQLERKLKIIESLMRGKTGPVKALDYLSQIIPKEVWLTSWKEKNGKVEVKGEALDNKFVAQFMSALKNSVEPDGLPGQATGDKSRAPDSRRFFNNIRLKGTQAFKDKKMRRTLVSFTIMMNVNYAI